MDWERRQEFYYGLAREIAKNLFIGVIWEYMHEKREVEGYEELIASFQVLKDRHDEFYEEFEGEYNKVRRHFGEEDYVQDDSLFYSSIYRGQKLIHIRRSKERSPAVDFLERLIDALDCMNFRNVRQYLMSSEDLAENTLMTKFNLLNIAYADFLADVMDLLNRCVALAHF